LKIQSKSWIITIFIFLVVLFGGVVIWEDCVLNPQPSETALKNIENTEKAYQDKISEIKKGNEKLEEQIDTFNRSEIDLEDREYFKSFKIDSLDETKSLDGRAEEKKYNPDLVN